MLISGSGACYIIMGTLEGGGEEVEEEDEDDLFDFCSLLLPILIPSQKGLQQGYLGMG